MPTEEIKTAESPTVVRIVETEPIIAKIEMLDGGRQGLKVTYSTSESRNGLISKVDKTNKHRCPVQRELRDSFMKLRLHLLKMTGYYWPNDKVRDMQMAQTIVNWVALSKSDQFQLSGTKSVLGSYTIPIKGPSVRPEDYELYDEFIDLVEFIKKEANLFIKGMKSADTKIVVIDHLTIKKGVTNAEEAYASMSEAEIEAITKEALDESGLYLMMKNDQQVIGIKEVESIDEDADFNESDEDVEPVKTEVNEFTDEPFVHDDMDIPNLDDL